MKIKDVRLQLKKATEALAKILSNPKVNDVEVIEALHAARVYEKVFKDDAEVCKKKIIPLLKQAGKIPEGKKQYELNWAGWKLAMHPTRSGLDPTKVASRVIAKKSSDYLQEVMVLEPHWLLPEPGSDKDKKLRKMFTEEELKEMEYEESWTVKTPTEE
jgi:hypothetical protein